MNVALAVWSGEVSTVFDFSRELLVVTIEDGVVVGRRAVALESDDVAARMRTLENLEVHTLICGAISAPLARLVVLADVELGPDVNGSVEDVLEAFIAGTLNRPAFHMPRAHCRNRGQQAGSGAGRRQGCCRRRGRNRAPERCTREEN